MSLWSPRHRILVAAAGMSVLAAVYAVEAWGQGDAGPPKATPGNLFAPTVSVSTLRVPAAAWKHFDRASSAAVHHRGGEFERESAKALDLAPEFAQMYLLRATVEVNAHQFEAGIASVQAALRFDPGTVWAGVVLAAAYNGARRFPDALLVLNAQRGREAESWQAMYERARAETGAHETAAALRWSGLALEAAPREFVDTHLVRANALLQAGWPGEAAGELTVYLDSKAPQPHRAQAMALLYTLHCAADADVQAGAPGGVAPDRAVLYPPR